MKHLTRRDVCKMLPSLGLLAPGFAPTMAQLVTGISKVKPGAGQLESKLEIDSSSAKLVDVFHWARSQAMACAFDSGDPVGPWYEAVEPGREGFCIRDTCHQALGAQALGLARFNLNMLRRFAENISDSKDWSSYWEIDRYNRPAPVDYENDASFWYNLPSNFDLLDCCYRMYVWSGDLTYVQDPVFLNFYDHTVNDYVQRWGLDLDRIMKRPRLLNQRGIFDPNAKFPPNRGIPGYDEGDHDYVIGFDVLVTQRAAYLAYAHIQQARQNAALAGEYLRKAAAVENLMKTVWWNKTSQCFYSRESGDHRMEDCGGRGAGEDMSIDWRTDVIPDPAIIASSKDSVATMTRLLDLSHARLEYPEVSYSRIGDIVTDAMGIRLEYSSPLLSAVAAFWVEVTVRTLSRLGSGIEWAEIRNLPIRACEVTVRHDGPGKTTFTNQRGPALIWRAMFEGQHGALMVNGREVKATSESDDTGRTVSSVRVTVGAGGEITVSSS
ncbi:MAG: hypothetical protein ABSD70_09780 [Terracidiphilus sp.]